jgi:hypothetical protein
MLVHAVQYLIMRVVIAYSYMNAAEFAVSEAVTCSV